MLLVTPVAWFEPCVKFRAVPATWTPRPYWTAFVPPVVAVGPPAPWTVWLSVSSNSVVLDLKPVVLTLAMLLAVTSSMRWWAPRPEMPVKRDCSMWGLLDQMKRWVGQGVVL